MMMADTTVRILVLQWAHAGGASDLAAVEDVLSALTVEHGAKVERYRGATFGAYADGPPPDEVHVLTFPDMESVDSYVTDPARAPWAVKLGAVLARTMVIQLDRW